jgi:hypothetical protein
MKVKLYALTEDLNDRRAKKKRLRTKYSEINEFVEELVIHSTAFTLKTNQLSTDEEAKIKVSCTDKNATPSLTKSILKGHIPNGLSA